MILPPEMNNYKETDEKLKAAYALNLCTVSISQIIDYDDMTVLNQEYDAILNNLNLEEIPKDEALLNVLKQILDTISFIRTSEGEQRQVDKDYQAKMKNALWNAVPNMALIVHGDIRPMLFSLATEVGISYMNYRKSMAEADREVERSYWNLERSAIEELNKLRRELFDTAWRLADKYSFSDSYRLTEKEIRQYNEILMDCDVIRRYERLYAIKDSFIAYPPFWYYFGHAAEEAARSKNDILNEEDRLSYIDRAKQCYQLFYDARRYNLLRENSIACAGALEYAELLDRETDKHFIHELIHYAVKESGNQNDVLQLCAISYLRIGDYQNAAVILKRLVNEQYNLPINGQILSALYAKQFSDHIDCDITEREYKLLATRVDQQFLFPLPVGELGTVGIQVLEKDFLSSQKNILHKEFEAVIEEYMERQTMEFNKLLPLPSYEKDTERINYLYSYNGKNDRLEHARTWFLNENNAVSFKKDMAGIDCPGEIIAIVNEIFEDICEFKFVSPEVKEQLWKCIRTDLSSNGAMVNELILDVQSASRFSYEQYVKLQDITLDLFLGNMFRHLMTFGDAKIDDANNMIELSDFEYQLYRFCMVHKLISPDLLAGHNLSGTQAVETHIFSVDMFGKEAQDISARMKVVSDLVKEFDASKQSLMTSESPNNIIVLSKNDPEFSDYFHEHNYDHGINNLSVDAIAVIDDKSVLARDLVFTSTGITLHYRGTILAYSPYKDVTISSDHNRLWIGNRQFTSRNLNLAELWKLIGRLKGLSEQIDTIKASGDISK